MLTVYQDIRDRIYTLARDHGLRVDWSETTQGVRLLFLYDRSQVLIARTNVPVRGITVRALDDLQTDL
ncbi:hypothetical protein GCM10010160_02030 [Acrocarpospora corrugata]